MSSYETFEDQQQSPIEFERVSEQYVKGNDVVAYFTVLKQIDVNEENDRVGLMRIGTTSVKDCLLFGEVHFDETSETDSVRRGTATFPSSVLPVSNEEMYKFCYLSNLTKLLGTSSPFQLNFEPDDIELLSNDPFGRDKMESLVAIANSDDDMVVVQPKRVYIEEKLRQENRQLSDMNNRLENEKIEYQTQLKILMFKQKEAEKKFKGDIQALTDAQQQANDDLRVCQETEAELRAEYDVCRAQCDRYKKEIDEQSKCCREFEEKNAKILVEIDQIRRQAVTSEQALRDQQTQLADLERRLLQANETNKSLTQRHNILEERIRELSATSDKQQLNIRTQIDEYNRQIEQRENQIRALQETNHLCQEELNTIKNENDNLVEMSQQDKILVKQLQDELEQCRTNLQEENDNIKQQLNNLRAELNERKSGETALTQSMKELEKRCVKHQKQEVEAKRQLTHYQETIKDFEEQIRELKQRVIDGGKKYENLYRNYKHLEESVKNNSIEEQKEVPRAQTPEPELVPPETNREEQEEEDVLNAVLTNTAPLNNNQNQRSFSLADRQTLASVDGAVKNCPVCDWEFPQNLSVDGKRLHIEEHFNDH